MSSLPVGLLMFDGREELADFKYNRGAAPSYLTNRIGRRAMGSLLVVMGDCLKKEEKNKGITSPLRKKSTPNSEGAIPSNDYLISRILFLR
jgi:hypothetical protein